MRATDEAEIESLATAELVEALRRGFAGRPSVALVDLAKMLKLDEKTLLRHVRSGRLPFRPVGTGRKRIRRQFTIGDVLTFYENLGTPAPARPVMRSRPVAVPTGGGLIGCIPRPVRPKRGA